MVKCWSCDGVFPERPEDKESGPVAGKRKIRKLRRRNPLVPVVRLMGRRVKPSAKRYKRRCKHREARNAEPGTE